MSFESIGLYRPPDHSKQLESGLANRARAGYESPDAAGPAREPASRPAAPAGPCAGAGRSGGPPRARAPVDPGSSDDRVTTIEPVSGCHGTSGRKTAHAAGHCPGVPGPPAVRVSVTDGTGSRRGRRHH
jgi:hypothetical protein